jgi:hypothetical protein
MNKWLNLKPGDIVKVTWDLNTSEYYKVRVINKAHSDPMSLIYTVEFCDDFKGYKKGYRYDAYFLAEICTIVSKRKEHLPEWF